MTACLTFTLQRLSRCVLACGVVQGQRLLQVTKCRKLTKGSRTKASLPNGWVLDVVYLAGYMGEAMIEELLYGMDDTNNVWLGLRSWIVAPEKVMQAYRTRGSLCTTYAAKACEGNDKCVKPVIVDYGRAGIHG